MATANLSCQPDTAWKEETATELPLPSDSPVGMSVNVAIPVRVGLAYI